MSLGKKKGFGHDGGIRNLLLTERPTVPRPKTTTVDPSEIFATFQAAPKPSGGKFRQLSY